MHGIESGSSLSAHEKRLVHRTVRATPNYLMRNNFVQNKRGGGFGAIELNSSLREQVLIKPPINHFRIDHQLRNRLEPFMALLLALPSILISVFMMAALFDIQRETRKSRIALEALVEILSTQRKVSPTSVLSTPPSPTRPYTPSPPRKRQGDATQPFES